MQHKTCVSVAHPFNSITEQKHHQHVSNRISARRPIGCDRIDAALEGEINRGSGDVCTVHPDPAQLWGDLFCSGGVVLPPCVHLRLLFRYTIHTHTRSIVHYGTMYGPLAEMYLQYFPLYKTHLLYH